MPIEGQGSSPFDDRGFTMVVLLVVIAVMAIGMTAMLPRWGQQAIREKEEELIFRGNQYARAIVLYARKNNNVLPASIDVLYEGKYLRRKWKDPITGEDFALLPAGQPANAGRGLPQGMAGQAGVAGPGTQPGAARGTGPGTSAGSQIVGSFQGVYSKSTDTSIRVYQNQQRYIDWQFTMQTAMTTMGVNPAAQQQGGRGGQPGRAGGPADGRGGIGGGPAAPGRGGAQPAPAPRGGGPGTGGPGAPGTAGRGGRGGG